MSGAGTGGAGEEEAGWDGISPVGPPRNVTPPRALYFDGRTRDFFLITATGLYKNLHPVDQKMAMAQVLRRGSVPADPDLGSTLHQIEIGDEDQMTADAAQRANQAAAHLIEAGDVRIKRVRCFSPRDSRVRVEIDYDNLALREEERAAQIVLDS